MKFIFWVILLSLIFINPGFGQELNGKEIIEKSQKHHDPNGNWKKANFEAHIQEPRIRNPYRYSIIKMNIGDDTFELTRNRGEHISTHIIGKNGESSGLLDGEFVQDKEVLKQYRLNSEMNNIYKTSYNFRLGMPMSLTEKTIEEYGQTTEAMFNGEEAYKVEIELKEPIFSEYWKIYISRENYKLLGVEIVFPDDPTKGERLYYDGEFKFDGITIPRMTHWHEYAGDGYSGSDIIVKKLPE